LGQQGKRALQPLRGTFGDLVDLLRGEGFKHVIDFALVNIGWLVATPARVTTVACRLFGLESPH
jgi:hypothetical protein